MAKAEIKEILPIEAERLFHVIAHYEDYPQFVEGCTGVQVERKGPGHVRVRYEISMMKDVSYTLDHQEDREKLRLEWHLVESDFFKVNNGYWQLKSLGPKKTEAVYSLEVEFKIPVPGFILNKLVKGNLPSMVKSFHERAKKVSAK
jgi:ribosome-associated toxin RatA of RatAB toxin-antitoxin module